MSSQLGAAVWPYMIVCIQFPEYHVIHVMFLFNLFYLDI